MGVVLGFVAMLALGGAAQEPAGSSAPPPAPATVPAAAPVAAPVATADNTMVCKSIALTGTRFPTRECHTRAEWTAMSAAARDYVNKATTGVCTANGCH